MNSVIFVSSSSVYNLTYSLGYMHPFLESTTIKDSSNLVVVQGVFSISRYDMPLTSISGSPLGQGLGRHFF